MAITATCQHCGKQYRVGDQLAGKKAKCKNCGGVFAIPVPAAPGGEELLDFAAMDAAQPAAPVPPPLPRRAAARPATPPQPAAPAEAQTPGGSGSNDAFYALRALLVVLGIAAVVTITLRLYIASAREYAQHRPAASYRTADYDDESAVDEDPAAGPPRIGQRRP